jgi:hypothetical protein
MKIRRISRSRARNEDGIALILVLMTTSLMTALAVALILTTMAERRIAGHFGRGTEAFYAADAALERAMQDLLTVPDWNAVLTGTVTSTFVDGAPGGVRALDWGGPPFDLTTATNVIRCGKAVCTTTDLIAATEDRPYGANNPIWQPFAYGPLYRLLTAERIDSTMYVVVWVADDPSENDADPLTDGGLPVGCDAISDPACAERNGGRNVLLVTARAYGPDGTQRTLEATIGRTDSVRILAWREVR